MSSILLSVVFATLIAIICSIFTFAYWREKQRLEQERREQRKELIIGLMEIASDHIDSDEAGDEQ